MKHLNKFLLTFLLALSIPLYAQNTIYVDTAMRTDPGASPYAASCIFTGGTVYGSTASISVGYSIADDFTVPSGQTWRLDSIIVFAYQTNSTTTSTFNAGRLRIWNATPPGGTVIFGDETTNRMTGTWWYQMYRVTETTLTNTARPIMCITLNAGGTIVTAGTYWIEYWLGGTLSSGPFTNPKVLPGRLNPPGQNALQRTISSNTWAAALDGSSPIGFNLWIKGQNLTAVGNNNNEIPAAFELSQNYPNPFNPVTTINYAIAKAGNVKIVVTDVLGKEVAVLVDEEKQAGYYNVSFDGTNLPSGTYFYSILAGDFKDTKRMILVK